MTTPSLSHTELAHPTLKGRGAEAHKPKHDNFYTPANERFYTDFRYAALNTEDHHIRLLRILPPVSYDDKSLSIQCEVLDNVSMEAFKGRYTTVSYCAGDPKRTEIIIVNGLGFNAFANLGHALRQARYFWKDRYGRQELLLWADQVCINQSSPSERAHQVSFMGDIYANAEQVLVSLSSEADVAGGLAWLEKLNAIMEQDLENQFDTDGKCEIKYSMRELVEPCWHQEAFHLGWDIFASTCLISPWWNRAWVRQELIRSTEASFMASFDFVTWHDLWRALGFYVELHSAWDDHKTVTQSRRIAQPAVQPGPSIETSPHLFDQATSRVLYLLVTKQKSTFQPDGPGDLLDQLAYAHACEASDPRDLVYAFFGISNHSYGLDPNYSSQVSLVDVLCHLARNVIQHNHNLDILDFAYARAPRPTIELETAAPDIPSWIPGFWHEGSFKPTALLNKQAQDDPTRVPILLHDRGRYDHILRVQGILHEVLHFDSATPDDPGGPAWFKPAWYGRVRAGDEVWMLYGARTPFILRRQDESHTLIKALRSVDDQDLRLATAEAARLVECNHPSVETVGIC